MARIYDAGEHGYIIDLGKTDGLGSPWTVFGHHATYIGEVPYRLGAHDPELQREGFGIDTSYMYVSGDKLHLLLDAKRQELGTDDKATQEVLAAIG